MLILCFVVQSTSGTPAISNVRAFCRVKAGLSAGGWYVCVDCVARRIDPTDICEMCVNRGLAPSLGSRDTKLPPPFKCRACITIESARYRGALVEDYDDRRDPMSARRYTFGPPVGGGHS